MDKAGVLRFHNHNPANLIKQFSPGNGTLKSGDNALICRLGKAEDPHRGQEKEANYEFVGGVKC